MSLPVGGTMRFLNSVNSWNAIQSRERGAKATHRVGYGRRDSSVSGSQIVSRIENQATTLSGRQVHSAKSVFLVPLHKSIVSAPRRLYLTAQQAGEGKVCQR